MLAIRPAKHLDRPSLTEVAFASLLAEGSRGKADAPLESTAKYIRTPEANTFGDALDRGGQTQESAPRLAQAHFFYKDRWRALKDFPEESPKMTQ